MKQQILNSIENPSELENLYHQNKKDFLKGFLEVYPTISEQVVAQVWYERLKKKTAEKSPLSINWAQFIGLIVLVGTAIQFPNIFGLEADIYYAKYLALIQFAVLSIYFLNQNNSEKLYKFGIPAGFLLLAVIITLIHQGKVDDVFILSAIHLGGVGVGLFGLAYLGKDWKQSISRVNLLKLVGDLIIISGLLLLCAGISSALTINLFESIHFPIGDFYGKNIVGWLLAPIPLVGVYLLQTNTQLVSKISPIIAKIFSPIALVMLSTFLVVYLTNGQTKIQDREFLLLFNGILIAVLALIFFSVANRGVGQTKSFGNYVLCLLGIVAILVNGVAFNAIIERILEFGFSPNRLAVFGSNLLILIHLLGTTIQFVGVLFYNQPFQKVEKAVVQFLPIYLIWFLLVGLGFPLLF